PPCLWSAPRKRICGARGRASCASLSSAGRGMLSGPPCRRSWGRCGRPSSTQMPPLGARGGTRSESSSACGRPRGEACTTPWTE
ncbi:unnamed protein product, partial [Ectocarpus sp. 12 AP-2014]